MTTTEWKAWAISTLAVALLALASVEIIDALEPRWLPPVDQGCR